MWQDLTTVSFWFATTRFLPAVQPMLIFVVLKTTSNRMYFFMTKRWRSVSKQFFLPTKPSVLCSTKPKSFRAAPSFRAFGSRWFGCFRRCFKAGVRSPTLGFHFCFPFLFLLHISTLLFTFVPMMLRNSSNIYSIRYNVVQRNFIFSASFNVLSLACSDNLLTHTHTHTHTSGTLVAFSYARVRRSVTPIAQRRSERFWCTVNHSCYFHFLSVKMMGFFV